MESLKCKSLSNRTEKPIVFANEAELDEIILSVYQKEDKDTTIDISCDSTRTLVGTDKLTCLQIGPDLVDWRPTPMPVCVRKVESDVTANMTLTQTQQIIIGSVIGGFFLLALLIGVPLLYRHRRRLKEKAKGTARNKRDQNQPEVEPNVVEYVRSKPTSYDNAIEPELDASEMVRVPEPPQSTIQYTEAPMQLVQAPSQMEVVQPQMEIIQPVQMVQAQPQIVQDQVYQEPMQIVQEPSQMVFEQPVNVIQTSVDMSRHSSSLFEAPIYEHLYEQVPSLIQTPLPVGSLVEAPLSYVQTPVSERSFQSQMVVPVMLPEAQYGRDENHLGSLDRGQRKQRVLTQQNHGRAALGSLDRRGQNGWRIVEAPLRTRTNQRYLARSHSYQPTSRVVGIEEIRDDGYDVGRRGHRLYR
ncbi:unnamed protein product [Owenia fusiformis]|uniref:Uncharacterized protein n=1 Tax=Owenia fusiformis TaxID=6347 RepID=A0A8S4PB20_OWEFU|nr:unnamed protein product [Owenia fusiformis]